MRRGKLTNNSVLLVIMAGFFALLSFFLDQRVIQKEDTVRNVEINIQNKIEKVNELSTNSLTVLMIEDRAQTVTNYYTFFSTMFYKTYLNLEQNDDFKKYFNEQAKDYITNFIKFDLNYILYDLTAIRDDTKNMSFYHHKYKDKELQDKVESLFSFSYDFMEKSILDKMVSTYAKAGEEWDVEKLEDIKFSSNEIYEIYKYLFQLNKEFAISIKKLNDISNYFDKEEENESNELDLLTVKGKEAKILKNYFILTSILAQILSLMTLLFLFRNIIKEI